MESKGANREGLILGPTRVTSDQVRQKMIEVNLVSMTLYEYLLDLLDKSKKL